MRLITRFKLSCKKLSGISLFVLLIFFAPKPVRGNPAEIFKFADHLLATEAYEEAITEYYRAAFLGKSDSVTALAYLKIGFCYREQRQWDAAFIAFDRAKTFAADDSLLAEVKLAHATTSIAAGKIDPAQVELLLLANTTLFPAVKQQSATLLVISAILQQDWNKTNSFLTFFDKIFTESDTLRGKLVAAANRQKKSENRAKWLSTFLPGTGQLYARDYRNALNAFLLNTVNFSATAAFLYWEQYSNAVLYFAFLTERYYSGNRYQASQSVVKYENKIDEKFMHELLALIKSEN